MNPKQDYRLIWLSALVIAASLSALPAGCPDGAALDDIIGTQLAGLLAGSSSTSPVDDRGGQRPDGVSDDPAADDNGGLQPDDDPGQSAAGNAAPDATGDFRLKTALSGNGAQSGNADYRLEAGREKFKVEVQHFAPGTYEVRINGVHVADITVGPLGTAEIEFDSKVELGHTPFPDGFPETIRTGDEVSVGGLVSGVF
jgi:hypothetical protein